MFVKLTNANKAMNGSTLIINTDLVASVYSTTDNGVQLTIICSPDEKLAWGVQETVEQVYEILNNTTSKKK